MKWWDRMPWLVFWMLSFKPTFSLSSFTFIKRLFSYSSLSAIRVVSSAYLRLLIFLPATLIPACASSSLAFHMMYSSFRLNKQGDNIQPWRTPFPIWNHWLQDGRVEGHVFIFSCENSKIATNCWKTIDRRILDSTKKRYSTSKGKGGAPTRW